MRRIKDEVAILMGAASGIGEATAHFLDEEGSLTMVVEIDAARGQRTAAEENESLGGQP